MSDMARQRNGTAKHVHDMLCNKKKGFDIMTTINVKITFTESLLGTSPANENIYRDFIGSKAPDAASVEEEVATLGADAVAEKGMTVFSRTEDGRPMIYDYHVKGFFKDACGILARIAGKNPETGKKNKAVNESGKITAYKKVIDGLVFVQPRKIPLEMPGDMSICQRPLRAQTAQGERVALAMSEEAPEGTTATFQVVCLDDSLVPAVREWLNYGAMRGIGQWRNSGHGRFLWQEDAG